MWILYSDFDDTVCFHDGRGIRQIDVDAIHAFQDHGNLFVVSTGRPVWMKQEIVDMIDGRFVPDYYLFSNGSCILDSTGKPLHEITIEPAKVRQILEAFPDDLFLIHSLDPKFNTGFEKVPGKKLMEIADGNYDHIYSISFDHKDERGQKIFEYCTKMEGLDTLRNSKFCDVVNHNAGKGKAIEIFKDIADLPQARSGAIGDSYNDVSMIEAADLGFTFEESPEPVKASADYLVDGVWQAVEILEKQD